jgi:tetrapyrrole methylase family protein/MazG family protein
MGITIVGLGPAGVAHVGPGASEALAAQGATIVLRTLAHPAAQALASERSVVTCDDLYDSLEAFDEVYSAIAHRVVDAAASGPVVYAVPGSAVVGERAVPLIRSLADNAGIEVCIEPGLSFLDLAYIAVGVDPITDGVQILDARDLPDPLPLHMPTFITQVDSTLRATDVGLALMRTIAPDTSITVLDRLGDRDEVVDSIPVSELSRQGAGPRTSVYVPPTSSGLHGLIDVNRILRDQCPWDKEQTHHTLVTHLLEEAYETIDAISVLSNEAPGGDTDFGAYAEVEEELGDLLLQVVFHATMAAEAGAFDIDEVAEAIRRKLVARHPHVFGDVSVEGPEEVLANWEEIKQAEKNRASLMDDVPVGMPGIAQSLKVQKRARSIGFDWQTRDDVISVLRSEIDELVDAGTNPQAVLDELGDVLFAAVNLARHCNVDPEVALRSSVEKFRTRFRIMEDGFAQNSRPMRQATPEELEAAWQEAKRTVDGTSRFSG